jgi:hypothetical protein
MSGAVEPTRQEREQPNRTEVLPPAFAVAAAHLRGWRTTRREDVPHPAARVAAEWLALVLVTTAIIYGIVLLFGPAVGLLNGANWSPDAISGVAMQLKAPWPFPDASACAHDRVGRLHTNVESVIATAPIWLRNSLLGAAAGGALVRLTGFHRARSGDARSVGAVQVAGGALGLRLSVGNERLAALLAEAAPELREELAAREHRHAAQDGIVASIVGGPLNLIVPEAESANPSGPGRGGSHTGARPPEPHHAVGVFPRTAIQSVRE